MLCVRFLISRGSHRLTKLSCGYIAIAVLEPSMLGFARRVAFGRYLFLAVILAWCLVLARENVRCYVAPTHSQMTATLGYAEVCSCFIRPVLRHTVFPWWTDTNTWKDGCSSAQSWLHFGNYHLTRLFSSHLVLPHYCFMVLLANL